MTIFYLDVNFLHHVVTSFSLLIAFCWSIWHFEDLVIFSGPEQGVQATSPVTPLLPAHRESSKHSHTGLSSTPARTLISTPTTASLEHAVLLVLFLNPLQRFITPLVMFLFRILIITTDSWKRNVQTHNILYIRWERGFGDHWSFSTDS